MTYFKIIRDGAVIDAGCAFLKLNTKHQILMLCEPKDAQFVQSFDEQRIYHDHWLRSAPNGIAFESADIQVIEAEEYSQLLNLLRESKEGSNMEDDAEAVETSKEIPTEETSSMSMYEMRQKILKQQEQIERLLSQMEVLLKDS